MRTRRPIVVVNWTNEEGARFAPAMLASGLIIIGVNQYWQYILTGLVLGAAVYLDQIRRRLRERA